MRARRNDEERRQWVLNDEGLYNWWRQEMRGEHKMRLFIKNNRAAIDEAIDRVLNPKPRSEYGLGYMQGRGAS